MNHQNKKSSYLSQTQPLRQRNGQQMRNSYNSDQNKRSIDNSQEFSHGRNQQSGNIQNQTKSSYDTQNKSNNQNKKSKANFNDSGNTFEQFVANNKTQQRIHKMRQEIDVIREQYEQRLWLHQKFKRLINYKDRLSHVQPIRNEEFSHTLGGGFYERQKIAHMKIMERKNNSLESPKHQHNWRSSEIQQEGHEPFMSKYKQDLEEKTRKFLLSEKKIKIQRIETLDKGISLIQKIFEILILKISELKDKEPNIQIQNYLLDQKYRLLQLVQYLQSRSFYEFTILLQKYENIPFPVHFIRVGDIQNDVQVFSQMNQLLQTKQDESYQNVLTQKIKDIIVKYEEIYQQAQQNDFNIYIPTNKDLRTSPTQYQSGKTFGSKKKSLQHQKQNPQCNNNINISPTLTGTFELRSKEKKRSSSVMNQARRNNHHKILAVSDRNNNNSSQLENYSSIDNNGANWELSQNDLARIGIFNSSMDGGPTMNLENIQSNQIKIKERLNKTASIKQRRSIHSNPKMKVWMNGIKKNPQLAQIVMKEIEKFAKRIATPISLSEMTSRPKSVAATYGYRTNNSLHNHSNLIMAFRSKNNL